MYLKRKCKIHDPISCVNHSLFVKISVIRGKKNNNSNKSYVARKQTMQTLLSSKFQMKTIFWSSFFAMLFFSCGGPKQTGYGYLTKVKEQKLKETSNLPIAYIFYRASDTLCKLYYKVDPKYLLRKNDSFGNLSTDFRVQVEIKNKSKFNFEIEKEHQRLDSVSVLDSITFSAPYLLNLNYEIGLADLNKHTIQSQKSTWYRFMTLIPEDILLIEKESRLPLIENFIYQDQIDLISSLETKEFVVSSSSENQFPSTSMYDLKRIEDLDDDSLNKQIATLEEIVRHINLCDVETHFTIWSKESNGEALVPFSVIKLQHADRQTIEPLIYLLRGEPITINSWVKFWSEASANDLLKAEKLIQEFNRRVEYANVHFSTHKLGWKTDRGMMYILFGPPDRIIKELTTEVWSYGFTNSVQREFVFQRDWMLNTIDFILDRNLGFYEIELSAIQRWKNGWVRYGWDGNQ